MPKRERPILGVTMGDPAGVGPEVIARALADSRVHDWSRPLVLGDAGAMAQAVRICGLDLEVRALPPGREPEGRTGLIEVLPLSDLDLDEFTPGRPSLAGGRAAAKYIEAGAAMALDGRIQALVTGPISKEALNRAGYDFPGHTEMLAGLTGGARVVMMLAGARLRVVLVTIHAAYAEVPRLLTGDKIIATAAITQAALEKYFGLTRPRLAAAALNPHAGEGGLFGKEETEIIAPAVAEAQARGLNLTGPYPADTLFYRAAAGEFDAVVCMYHDQGLIPFKLLHFRDGVNVTLGLPFVRTSVDHGTAFDLAGTGRADPGSMSAALRMAADMAGRSKQSVPDLSRD